MEEKEELRKVYFMNNNDINLTEKDCEFFGGSILMLMFGMLFGEHFKFPEELKNKALECVNEDGTMKENKIDELEPLIEEYYNKCKEEFYGNIQA